MSPTEAIALLSGKPVRPGTVMAGLREHLRSLNYEVRVHLVGGPEPLSSCLFDSTLVVQRTLGIAQLSAVLPLEEAGVRCCNRIAATIAVKNRELTVRSLGQSGLPVPKTTTAVSWRDVIEQTRGRPIVVKTLFEITGRGRGVLVAPDGILPREQPFTGPYLLQEYIVSDGRDYKVYAVGDNLQGLIKSRPLQGTVPAAESFAVDAAYAALSLRVGTALQLEIYGVDILQSPLGPVVVDVNPFPGFRGVPEAVPLIGRYVLSRIASSV